MRARRAPKYWVFGVIGALGALVFTAVLASVTPPSDGLSKGQAFGLVFLWVVPIGIAVLLACALLIDWIQRRHAKEVTAIKTKLEFDGAEDNVDPDIATASPLDDTHLDGQAGATSAAPEAASESQPHSEEQS